jgi:Fe2+ or Zn2+ uptake regulation protein
VIEFQNPIIEEAIKQASLAHGFQSEGHSFIVRGVCKECNIARMPKRQLDLI